MIRANRDSPLTGPLRQILVSIEGPVALLARKFGGVDGIFSAFLYGSFAARLRGVVDGPAPHDIDVMVVGTPDTDVVYAACTRVEDAVYRPVNPTILSADEFAADSNFLDSVRSGPVVAVIGELPWK